MIDNNKTSSYHDKINDHFDKKIIDFNLKAVAFLGSIFIKPIATASDPFFRKNLGERYFTSASFFLGFVLWLGAALLGKVSENLLPMIAFNSNWESLFKFADWANRLHLAFWIGMFVFVAFAVLAGRNTSASAKRQRTGEHWHSMSRGESLWGSENPRRDFILALLASLFLLVFALPVGVLFFCSRIGSAILISQEQASIYARFLDYRDATIESEHLQRALDEGAAPRLTEGLYGPLPKRFTGEHRTEIAWVAAGGGGNGTRVADRQQQPAASSSATPPPASSGRATARAANHRPGASSPKTASSVPTQVATPVASPARVAKNARQDATQSRTTWSNQVLPTAPAPVSMAAQPQHAAAVLTTPQTQGLLLKILKLPIVILESAGNGVEAMVKDFEGIFK